MAEPKSTTANFFRNRLSLASNVKLICASEGHGSLWVVCLSDLCKGENLGENLQRLWAALPEDAALGMLRLNVNSMRGFSFVGKGWHADLIHTAIAQLNQRGGHKHQEVFISASQFVDDPHLGVYFAGASEDRDNAMTPQLYVLVKSVRLADTAKVESAAR